MKLWLAVMLLVFAGAGICEEEKTTTSITGTVSMPDGSPAVRATVEIRNPWEDREVAAVAITDEDGRFEANPPMGRYFLHAASGLFLNYELYTLVDVTHPGDAKGPYELRLEKGCTLNGTVTDKQTGHALGGVRVTTRTGDTAVTPDTGSFSLLLPRGNHTITAIKEGLHRPIVHINTGKQDMMSLMIELKPGGTIKGKVTDEDGQPIAGASVGPSTYSFRWQRNKTDENGEYSLSGFALDERAAVSAWFDKERGLYEWTSERDVVFPPGENVVTADFELVRRKTRYISGRVVRQDGTPVEGATVVYGMGSNYGDSKDTKSDKDGKYLLKDVNVAHSLLLGRAKGCAPRIQYVEANVDAKVDFTLEPGHWLEATVEDEDGNPLKDIRVSVSMESELFERLNMFGRETYRWIAETSTDEEGRFRLEDMPADQVIIETYAKGYARIDEIPLKVDRDDHILVMYKPGQVSGTVLSAEDDKPIQDFRVADEFGDFRTFSSPDGTFMMSNDSWQAGDRTEVKVEAPGYRRNVIYAEVKSPSEDNPSANVIRLKKAHTFRGAVTDRETGDPLEGVLVTVIDYQGSRSFYWQVYEYEYPLTARTDAKGEFEFADMPAVFGSVMLELSGYGRIAFRDIALVRPLTARLEKAATITGIARHEAGNPAPNTRVTVQEIDKDLIFPNVTSDAEGRFSVTDLPPGRYMVNISGESRVERLNHFEVKAGETHEVDWDQPTPAQLDGTVTRRGVPVEDASITLYPKGEFWWNALGRTDKDGNYRASIPAVGDHHMRVSTGLRDPGRGMSVTIQPGMNRLDVEMPGGSISGKAVYAATKKPIANSTMRCFVKQSAAEDFGGRQYWYNQHTELYLSPKGEAKTDADGRFEFTDLPEGEHVISLEDNGTRTPGTPVFRLGKDEAKTGLVTIPETSSAVVKVVDAETGESLTDAVRLLQAVNEQGFLFYPAQEVRETRRSGSKLMTTDEGKFILPGLTPGKYKVYPLTKDYSPEPTSFEVKAGQTADVTMKLRKGERIVFKLAETEDDPFPGGVWIGYKLTAPDGKPVLEDAQGPYLGDRLPLESDPPREGAIHVRPGTYRLEVVLRASGSSAVVDAEDHLWTTAQTIEVIAGKDTVIEIPRPGGE